MIRSWDDLLQRELHIDIEGSRLEMVRASVIAYLGCVCTGLLSLSVAQRHATAGALALVIIAAVTAAALWTFRRRVPVWILVVHPVYAAILLAVGLGAGAAGSGSIYSLFYMLVVLYGMFFLSTGAAAGLIVFCTLAFAGAAVSRGDPDWLAEVLRVFGASVTIGLLVGLIINSFRERAFRDGLTGLINRSMWESLVRRELSKAERSGRPFSILLIDLDRFKTINDELGHQQGDRILKRVAAGLHGVLREADTPCRWGGDEFSVLLSDCSESEIPLVSRRVHAALGDIVALSIGSATWRPGISAEELFEQADRSLYEVKANKDVA